MHFSLVGRSLMVHGKDPPSSVMFHDRGWCSDHMRGCGVNRGSWSHVLDERNCCRDHRPLALSNCTSRQELAQPSQAVVLRN